MKKKMRLLLVGLCLTAIFLFCCFLVPEYPEYPSYAWENIEMIRLNADGNRLLVRTVEHDYDFKLPANELNKALAQLPRVDAKWYARGTLIELQRNDDGSFSSRLWISFVGYDPLWRLSYVTLPDGELSRLRRLGFVPIVEHVPDRESNSPSNAKWSGDIVGYRRKHGNVGNYTGADISTICCGDTLRVALDTNTTLESNRRFNTRMRPFLAVRHGVEYAVILGYILLGGGSSLPIGPGG